MERLSTRIRQGLGVASASAALAVLCACGGTDLGQEELDVGSCEWTATVDPASVGAAEDLTAPAGFSPVPNYAGLVRDGSLEAPSTRSLRNMKDDRYYLFVPPEGAGVAAAGVQLSRREIEVLGLVAVGLASREIADRLCISLATVNNHRQHVLEKMKARNSAEAVRYAAQLGILGGGSAGIA